MFKREHSNMIEDNPIELVIYRTGRIPKDGGFENIGKVHVGHVRARLFQETTGRSGKAALEITTPGIILRNERWGLALPVRMRQVDPDTGVLVDPAEWLDTDVQDGPHVKDQFDVPEGHFEISKVWPRMDEAIVWGYVCELEELE